jgi:hypothetical protein
MIHFFGKEASMTRLPICLLALGLLALGLSAAPSQAATRADTAQAQAQAPREGMLDKSGGVYSGGRSYPLSGATIVTDRKGAPLAAPRLAPGRSVAFTITAESRPKVRQLWLID